MPQNWTHVAETVKQRRTELGLSQRQAARLANDISPTTWGSLEKHGQPVSTLTAVAICKALRWTADSIDALLAGGEPTVADAVDRAGDTDYNSRLARMPDHVLQAVNDIIDAEERRQGRS